MQIIKDTNNNDPVFSSPTYTYSLPMPLLPLIDYSPLGDSIEVEDIDFSNQNVTFTIEPSDLITLSSTAISGTKSYQGVLTAVKPVRLNTDTNFTITVTVSFI